MTVDQVFSGVTPYLRYADGDAAVAWLTRVLGFGPARAVRDPDGALTEGEIDVGDSRVMLTGGAAPGPDSGAGMLLVIGVLDVDAQYQRIRAAGEQIDPPRDEPYGPRTCHVTDPEGYRWYFWQGDSVYPPGE